MFCNLNAFDGKVARTQIDSLLSERNLSVDEFNTVIEYVDVVNSQFKSSFNRFAENGTFDLYYNGFFIEQMLISCTFEVRYIYLKILILFFFEIIFNSFYFFKKWIFLSGREMFRKWFRTFLRLWLWKLLQVLFNNIIIIF